MNANTESGLPYAEDAKDTQRTQKEQPKVENDFSHEIIGAAVEVQRVLGVGLLESAYSGALAIELAQRGLRFEREVLRLEAWPPHQLSCLSRRQRNPAFGEQAMKTFLLSFCVLCGISASSAYGCPLPRSGA